MTALLWILLGLVGMIAIGGLMIFRRLDNRDESRPEHTGGKHRP